MEALAHAIRVKGDVRDFAVSYEELRTGGLTDADLRCLHREGAIASTDESLVRLCRNRAARDDDLLTLPPDSPGRLFSFF